MLHVHVPSTSLSLPAPRFVIGLRRSLRFSVLEGITAEVFSSCSNGAVLTAWALAAGAGPFVIGLLLAMSQLAQAVQVPAAWATSTFGARRTAILAVALSRQVLLPLCLLPFVSVSSAAQQAILLTVGAVSSVFSVIGNNAWTTWMAELVPRRLSGRYFGWRTGVCTIASAASGLFAGALLDVARATGRESWALAALALGACIAGAWSTWLMRQQVAPRLRAVADEPIRWQEAARAPLRSPVARTFLAYQIAWNAAVGLAGSFFPLFMLRNLGLGFALVAAQATACAVLKALWAPFWGRTIDRLGARPVLIACSFSIACIPLVWLFASPTCLWPIVVDAVMTGALWGGQSQAAFQWPLSMAPRRGRAYYLAMFAGATGLSFALATALGGGLATRLGPTIHLLGRDWANFQVLFALSAVARGAAAVLALRIAEPGAQSVHALWSSLTTLVAQQRPWAKETDAA